MKHLLITFLCFSIFKLNAQTIETVTSKIDELAKKDKFSGTILLAKNNKIILNKTIGYANAETKEKLIETTPLAIASTGKIFTAIVIAKLWEMGKIDLNKPISYYLSDFKIENAETITIKQLLLHTSGLGNYMENKNFVTVTDSANSFHALLPLVQSTPLVFNVPGTKHQYSNSGYLILGKVIEKITGKSYETIVNDWITKVAGMSPLKYNKPSSLFAKGHIRNKQDSTWQVMQRYTNIPAPDGGVYTTAIDLFKLDKALYEGKIIKKSTLEMMQKNSVEATIPGLGKSIYGLGLMQFKYENGAYSWGHIGGMPGFSSDYYHYVLPNKSEYTLIIIANYDRVVRPIYFDIQDLILEDKF